MWQGSENLNNEQKRYARQAEDFQGWVAAESNQSSPLDLFAVVSHVKPSFLIGCSTASGAFDESVVRNMAENHDRPVILPLSNPSSKSEAVPQDLFDWTEGRALIATGSPFAPVHWQGSDLPVAQCNNAFIYPGLSLGLIVSKAQRLTSGMLIAASKALAAYAIDDDPMGSLLLPPLSAFPEYSKRTALSVAEAVRDEGFSDESVHFDFTQGLEELTWEPEYLAYAFDPAAS